MLDIQLIRNDPDSIRKDLERRKDPALLDRFEELLALDEEWRTKKQEIDGLRASRNDITQQIAALKKIGQDVKSKLEEAKQIPEKIKVLEDEQKEISDKRTKLLMSIPNIMHESVPYGKDDTENTEIKKWGKPRKFDFEIKNHAELAETLDVADFESSTKIAGAGFYFLKGKLALLNRALLQLAVDIMVKQGFTYVEPPLMMRREVFEGVTEAEAFDDVIYKIEGDDLYLIATSEHPLVGHLMNETIDESKLPLKMCGYSMCFRREVGSHGIDEKGLFRTHQFNKVEQVVVCKPEESWKIHEEMIAISEEIFQALELPYRIVNICTGDLGIIASKKYDLEVWMPRQEKYREACSCSNCTDYQARRLNLKIGKEGGDKRVAHTLNNTALATSRALVAILENYQNKDGSIDVPKALQKYLDFKNIP